MPIAILPASRGVANVCKNQKDSHIVPLIAALATFSGCGGGDDPPPPNPESRPGAALPARTLSWEPPTSYVDATPMNPVTELDQFEIYVNETGTFTDKDVPTASLGAVDPQPAP